MSIKVSKIDESAQNVCQIRELIGTICKQWFRKALSGDKWAKAGIVYYKVQYTIPALAHLSPLNALRNHCLQILPISVRVWHTFLADSSVFHTFMIIYSEIIIQNGRGNT